MSSTPSEPSDPSDRDPPLVATLAELARVELSAEESAALGEQLANILGYIRSLQTVDVEGVPEYLSADRAGSGLRSDAVGGPQFDHDAALAGVPVRRGSLVAVPKFKD